MLSRNRIFVLIAIYFIFSYPFMTNQWSLNMTMGIYPFRPWQTFLLPVWFLLIYAIYQKMAAMQIVIRPAFFWTHVLISILPTFIINYPFALYFLGHRGPDVMISASHQNVWIYLGVQFLFVVVLLYKIFSRRPQEA